jgi:hypothetical protein
VRQAFITKTEQFAKLVNEKVHARRSRCRVGEIRVSYDVSAGIVEVLAVVSKSEAGKWLEQFGSRE